MPAEAIGDLLPSALAVALSPIPLVAVVLVLGGSGGRGAGPAFAVGWVAGLAVAAALIVLVLAPGTDDGGADTATSWLDVGLGTLFLGMAVKVWRGRPAGGDASEMPGWMAAVDGMAPAKALQLGAALAAANPKNLALTLSAAAALATHALGTRDTTVAVAAFVAIGSSTVVGLVAFRLAAGSRAEPPLEAVQRFLLDHNAIIMTVVLVLLGAKLLVDGLALR